MVTQSLPTSSSQNMLGDWFSSREMTVSLQDTGMVDALNGSRIASSFSMKSQRNAIRWHAAPLHLQKVYAGLRPGEVISAQILIWLFFW